MKHFIIERFTMPIYIFILLAIPEILDCWKSCRLAPDKKVSGIKDTIYTLSKGGKRIAPAAAALVIVSTLAYNQFCVGEGVHGVFPYRSIFVPVSGLTDKMLETDYRALYNNADFMQFLGLANKGNYTIVASVNGDTGDMLEFQYRHLLKSWALKLISAPLTERATSAWSAEEKQFSRKQAMNSLPKISAFTEEKYPSP